MMPLQLSSRPTFTGRRNTETACVAVHQARTKPSEHRRCAAVPAAVNATTAPSAAATYVSKQARAALFGQAQEQVTEVKAAVKGSIPDWIDGALVLNGGGNYKGMQHMFDGYAMLSKLRIKGGQVWGSQRYISSKAYEHFKATGRMRWREFGTPVDARNPAEYAGSVADMLASLAMRQQAYTDNSSVNIVPLPNQRLLAMSETSASQYIVDASSLATLERAPHASNTPADGVQGELTTAHPKVLPDGTLVNFSRTLPMGGYTVYLQDPKTLSRRKVAFIPDRNPTAPAWVHDIAVSEHYCVIVEAPCYFNMGSLMLSYETEYVYMDWKPTDGMRIIVVPLDGSGKVETFEGDTFFSFHSVNAFEEKTAGGGTTLHVDMSVYDDLEILNDLLIKNIMNFPGKDVAKSHKRRLSIPLGTSARLRVPTPLLADESSYGNFHEFPTVNPANRGRPYRYSWGMGAKRPTNMGNALVKFDLQTRTTLMWHQDGCLPSEASFIPTPGVGRAEDEGVLLSAVMSAEGTSFLLALDAATMKELGRADLPYGVPYRFHGTFVPSSAN